MPKNTAILSRPAYDYLLELILTRALTPGTRISEAAVAEQLRISRSPVRDAMRQLASEGLLEIFPNRFAQVAQYTAEEIREIGVMRLTLDRLAIRLSLLYGSKADFFELQKMAERCYEASLCGDLRRQHQLDCDFHMQISRIAGNSQLIRVQSELYLRVLFIMVHYPHAFVDEKKQLDDHFQIADALIAQDKARALTLVTDNIVSFYGLDKTLPERLY